MNNYQKHTYPNGLELITIPMPGVSSATVMVMVGAGSRYERANINGISHFLEHMAFKGTKKRPSALVISSTIDSIGGEFNAFTGKDHTGFYVKARAAHVPLLLDVLSDMLLNSLLSKDEIEREKGVIIEEINMYKDTPIRHIGDVYEELMYGDHPLGWNIAGTPEVIHSITRENFVEYMEALYRPNNTVVVVAGGIASEEKEIQQLVGKLLGNWQKKDIWPWQKMEINQKAPKVKVEYKDTEQAHIAMGVHAYRMGHPKRFAISILSAILGGGMSSRLFIEVRERRGLGYYVRSSTDHYLDVGGFVTQAGVDVKRIDDAIKVINEQCFEFGKGALEIKDEELSKAKEYLKGKLVLELEDSRSVAGLYATEEILKRKLETPDEIIEKTDKVTKEEVLDVAKEIFVGNHLNLAVLGPYKDEERFKKLLS